MAFTGNNPRFNSTILTDIGLASVSNPPSGAHKLINRGGTFQVKDSSGLETAIGAGGTVDRITQTAHGFSEGEVLYFDGTDYARALANAANTSEIVGMVSRVIDVDTFELTLEGKVTGLSGLTAGEVYFLSPTVSGAITITEPSVLGHVSLPVGVAISATVFYVRSSRGAVVGSTNARTEIALFNNTTTNVQDASAYQAGELAGYVEIDGTTDLKFYVSAPFARNGAGTDYNISPQYVGDTPPVGFDLIITTAGIIRVTLPNIAGFVSAKINYGLNVPAVGATFPLAIDSTLVQFSTLKAKDSGGFVFQENGGTQIGSWSDTGALTVGPEQSLNYNGPAHQIAGASLMVRTPTSTNTDQAGSFEIGTNIYRGPYGNRFSTVTGGVGILFNNRTSVSTEALAFYSNLPGDSLTTGVYVAASMTHRGSWSFGSSSTTTSPHFFYANSNGDYTAVLDNSNGTQPLGLQIKYTTFSPNDAGKEFIYCNDTTTARFTVRSNGGIANYQANNVNLSDERVKTNIKLTSSKLDFICSLQVKDFEYKDKPGVINTGLIAQDVEALNPLLVQETGNKQIVDGEEINPKAVRTTEIYHMMIKAIQELSARLVALENKGV